MQNLVTQRFIQVHDRLKAERKIPSSRQFALNLGTAPQSLNQILKGRRDVTVKNAMALVELYDVNSEYLLAGIEPMFKDELPEKNDNKRDKIVYVPKSAHAGGVGQFEDCVMQSDLETFTLPGFAPGYGEHRCFDVVGDSMEPTLYSGDKVVCSVVSRDNNYSLVRDNYVYVVVTENDILVKRVVNKVKREGVLVLKSDNDFYNPIEVSANEIEEICLVRMKIVPFMPDPNHARNGFNQQILALQKVISEQEKTISAMDKTLERLLRMSR